MRYGQKQSKVNSNATPIPITGTAGSYQVQPQEQERQVAKFVIGNNSLKDLSKSLERRYKGCIQESAATALNITAARNRRAVQAQMNKKLDRPRKQTLNAVLFKQAKRTDRLDDMYSATYIRDWASKFLAPSFYGATITELYDRKPIITPVIANLQKGYGLGVKLNKFGNVPGLNKGKIDKVISNPNTFVIDLNSRSDLTPGIWYRNPRNNELVLLFLYERDSERRKVLDFNKIGIGVYNNTIAQNWQRALKECLQ